MLLNQVLIILLWKLVESVSCYGDLCKQLIVLRLWSGYLIYAVVMFFLFYTVNQRGINAIFLVSLVYLFNCGFFFLPIVRLGTFVYLLQEQQKTQDVQISAQVSHESQSDPQNTATDAPVADSGSVSVSSNEGRKVSREDIELVS